MKKYSNQGKHLSFSLLIAIVLLVNLSPIISIDTVQNHQFSAAIGSEMADPEEIMQDVYQYLWDGEYGGVFTEMNNELLVTDNSKALTNLLQLGRANFYLYEETNNSQYLTQAEALMDYIKYYQVVQGGYISTLDRTFTQIIAPYVSFNLMSPLVSYYTEMYFYTRNNTYLDTARTIQRFIEEYFYDRINGGYYKHLDSNNQPYTNFYRVVGGYSYYLRCLLDLYETTNESAYLEKGGSVLNETIEIAWDWELGYFYPYIDNTNQPVTAIDIFYVGEQLSLARTLLNYAKYHCKEYYENLALLIVAKVFEHGINAEGYVIHSFSPDGTIDKADTFVSRQYHALNVLEILKETHPLTQTQREFLNTKNTLLSNFQLQTTKLYFRTANDPTIIPWVNCGVIMALKPQLSDKPPPNTVIISGFSWLGIIGVIWIIRLSKRRKRKDLER